METMKQLGKFGKLTPATAEAFQGWNAVAFKDGALSHKTKELMAIACAATIGCDYCLDVHSKSAKRAGATEAEVAEALMIATAGKAGATKEELAETVFIASALNAGSAFTKSVTPLKTFD